MLENTFSYYCNSITHCHCFIQNIDLMNLAGFCRNCLSKWYAEAAGEQGVTLDKEAAREIVYGMPYDAWKAQYQTEATPEQAAQFAAQQSDSAGQ